MDATTRTLTGLDALALAVLRELPTVRVDGAETPVEDARLVSYDRPEAVSVEWTPAARGWAERYVETLRAGRGSMARRDRADARERREPAREEYVAAAALATVESELYDAQEAALRQAGWRPSQYERGQWYRLDRATGRALRTNGRVATVSRATALASLGADNT